LNIVELGMNEQESCEAANVNSYQVRSSFGAHDSRPGKILGNQQLPSWVRTELGRMGYTLDTTPRTSGPINAIYFVREGRLPQHRAAVSPEARKANQALVERLAATAAAKQATPAQIALAWVLAQKPWIVPIPGTTKVHRMKENVGAATVELTSDDLRQIGDALAEIKVHGDRYPAHLAARAGK
jgi:predicted oxidoreductase